MAEDISPITDRQTQILEASIRVFSKLGLSKARMDDIAKDSGLGKGTLYLYFKSKDEIIQHVVEKMIGGELKELSELKKADLPASEKIIKIAELAVADVKKLEPFFPLMYELYAYTLRSKKLRKILSQYFQHYVEEIVPIIEEGIQNNELVANDPRKIALSIGAIIEGSIILLLYDPSIEIEEQINYGIQLLLIGMLVNS